MSRFYDVTQDVFVSDRDKIIDILVRGASRLLIWSEVGDRRGPQMLPEQLRLIGAAQDGDRRHQQVLRHVVLMSWRSSVFD